MISILRLPETQQLTAKNATNQTQALPVTSQSFVRCPKKAKKYLLNRVKEV